MVKQDSGFSLIELMVVIAIVALLAAVAVPVYKSYVIKSKVSDGFNLANSLRKELLAKLELTGAFPSSISYAGATFAQNTYGLVNIGSTKNLRYLICPAANTIYTESALTGLDGISSSYVASPNNNNGTHASIRIVSRLNNGVYTNYCGLWNTSDTISIPLSYLPSSCTCTNLITICNDGTVSNPC